MFGLGRGDPYRRKPRLHAQTFVCLFSYAFSHVQFPLNYLLFSSSGDFASTILFSLPKVSGAGIHLISILAGHHSFSPAPAVL